MLIFTILVSSVKIGQKVNLTRQDSLASVSAADLSLQFTTPDKVSVLINSPIDVAGIDITLKYDKDKFTILPSTLSSGDQFMTTGGKLDKEKGTFSFSAIAKSGIKNTIVAAFSVRSLTPKINTSGSLIYVTGPGKTSVLEKKNRQNILGKATGVNITIPSQ